MMIYSCKDCQKRFPGCHGTCPDYLADKARYDALKAKRDKENSITSGIIYERSKKVIKAIKKRKGGFNPCLKTLK